MPSRLRRLFAGFLLASLATAAHASELAFTIRDGRVTLRAYDVTVAQILREWARLGDVRILNLDRLPGDLVTIELANVPEAEALETVLRSASGYVAAPRGAQVENASLFDRILIMPPSVAPPAVTGAPSFSPSPASQGFRPIFPRPGVTAPAPAQDPDADPEEESADPPVMFPGGGFGQPGFAPVQPQPGTQVFPGVVEFQRNQPTPETPPATGAQPTPGNPWGLPPGSSTKPGVVVQPPPEPRSPSSPPR